MNDAALTPTRSPARERYYQRIGRQHLTPLWEVLHALVPPAPNTPMQAALWRYREIRAAVLEAGELISAAACEPSVACLRLVRAPWISSPKPGTKR